MTDSTQMKKRNKLDVQLQQQHQPTNDKAELLNSKQMRQLSFRMAVALKFN